LIVFGLLLGEGVRRTGLAAAIESALVMGILPTDTTLDARWVHRRLLFVLCLSGALFAGVVPSALVRVLLLAPIVQGLSGCFQSRRARVGTIVGPLLATYFAGTGVLTGSLPNIVVAEIAAESGIVGLNWSTWMLVMFPVMGIGRALVIAAIIHYTYRPSARNTVAFSQGEHEPFTPDALRLAAFLLVGLALWTTDHIHGLHPMYGVFTVVILMLLPRIGVVSFDIVGDVDISIAFFIAAVFAIAAAIRRVGIVEAVATRFVDFFRGDLPLLIILLGVFTTTLLLMFVLEGVAVGSVFTPVLIETLASLGHPVRPVLLVEAIALGTYFFPYQSGVLVAIVGEGLVGNRELIRATSISSIAVTVLLLPPQLLVLLWIA
jgi:di/tricarboxylate transporter